MVPTGRVLRSPQGTLDQFWLWSMQAGLLNAYESIKAFSETDFTEDLKKFDIPTLVMHGEDDQIVPVKDSARKSARLIKGAKEIYYPGAPHGLTATHQDQVNADLLEFLGKAQKKLSPPPEFKTFRQIITFACGLPPRQKFSADQSLGLPIVQLEKKGRATTCNASQRTGVFPRGRGFTAVARF